MRMFLLFHFSLILCTSSCNTQISQGTDTNKSSASSPEVKKNQIIYLFLETEKTSNGEKITLQDKKTTDGVLKNSSIKQAERIPGNILVTILGNGAKVIEERIIEDPLNPMMESYSEEGMEQNKMKFQRAEFSIRFNQAGDATNVKLEKLTTTGKNHLLTIKI